MAPQEMGCIPGSFMFKRLCSQSVPVLPTKLPHEAVYRVLHSDPEMWAAATALLSAVIWQARQRARILEPTPQTAKHFELTCLDLI